MNPKTFCFFLLVSFWGSVVESTCCDTVPGIAIHTAVESVKVAKSAISAGPNPFRMAYVGLKTMMVNMHINPREGDPMLGLAMPNFGILFDGFHSMGNHSAQTNFVADKQSHLTSLLHYFAPTIAAMMGDVQTENPAAKKSALNIHNSVINGATGALANYAEAPKAEQAKVGKTMAEALTAFQTAFNSRLLSSGLNVEEVRSLFRTLGTEYPTSKGFVSAAQHSAPQLFGALADGCGNAVTQLKSLSGIEMLTAPLANARQRIAAELKAMTPDVRRQLGPTYSAWKNIISVYE